LNPHRVADRVQRLRADDDLRIRGIQVVRVVGGELLGAPHADEVDQLRAPHNEHAVLAVTRKDKVVGAQRMGCTDLHALLPLGRGPQPELTLPLKGNTLAVDAASGDHVAVHCAQLLGGNIGDPTVERGTRLALAIRRNHVQRAHERALCSAWTG